MELTLLDFCIELVLAQDRLDAADVRHVLEAELRCMDRNGQEWIGRVARKVGLKHEFQRTECTMNLAYRYTKSERRSSVRTVTSRRVFED